MNNKISRYDILEQRYRILDRIAVGGMAEVFTAYDQYLKRYVAIKALFNRSENIADLQKRFMQEYKAIASLRHHNIVAVYAYFTYQERGCIVLELIWGKTLKDQLLIYGPLTINELWYYIHRINQGVAYAHQHHIIHRDLKPENILLSHDGQVKITDFGVAVHTSLDFVKGDKIIGTAKYLAPEIIKDKMITHQGDIYSLGVMLYELVVGAVPFTGKNVKQIIAKQVRQAPIQPRTICTKIPVSLNKIIIKALDKNPHHRFRSILEFDNALQSVCLGELMEKSRKKVTKKQKINHRLDKETINATREPLFLSSTWSLIFFVIAVILLIVFILLEIFV